MTIMELGALGEFLGSIGVVATLIYLAIQIRQNTHSMDEGRRMAMAQSRQQWTAMITSDYVQRRESDYMPAIEHKLRQNGFAALTEEEQQRVRDGDFILLTRLDNLLNQYQEGFLAEDMFEQNFREAVRSFAGRWEERGIDLSRLVRPAFREEVNRILAEEAAQA